MTHEMAVKTQRGEDEAYLLVVLQLQRLVVPPEGVVVLGERGVSRLQVLQQTLALVEPVERHVTRCNPNACRRLSHLEERCNSRTWRLEQSVGERTMDRFINQSVELKITSHRLIISIHFSSICCLKLHECKMNQLPSSLTVGHIDFRENPFNISLSVSVLKILFPLKVTDSSVPKRRAVYLHHLWHKNTFIAIKDFDKNLY